MRKKMIFCLTAVLSLALILSACANAPAAAPAQPSGVVKQGQGAVIVWQRSGGFAGMCQRLSINSDDSYQLADCITNRAVGGKLSAEASAQINGWVKQYASFDWKVVPPTNSADMFNDTLTFTGQGSQVATSAQQEEIARYLASLAGMLRPAATPQ